MALSLQPLYEPSREVVAVAIGVDEVVLAFCCVECIALEFELSAHYAIVANIYIKVSIGEEHKNIFP